jgi:thiol-disulfide isomerase/thioredoxin
LLLYQNSLKSRIPLKYLRKLMKSIVLIVVFTICVGSSYGQEIKIINNYNNITSAPQLFAQLKGKTIFLDLWAPWCEPCKEEFKYSDTLYRELKKRHIAMLYVSLNFNVNAADWKADIKQYQLKGFHVMANKQLEDSLTELIWGHPGGFSIPRYLLIDPKGIVLLNDALSPDHAKQLYTQIDSTLRK